MYFHQSFSKSITLSSIILSSILLWENTAKAQVGISPLIIESPAKRSQAKGTIQVINGSDETFRARVYSELFTYDSNRGFQELKSSPNDLRPYLEFSPRELEVAAGTERNIRFVVRFPPSLPDGEYRAVVFTENLKEIPLNTGQTTTAIIGRVGTVVYVRKGNVSPNLNVASANWNPQTKQIELLVKNTGKATAYPSVNWTLKQGTKTVTTGVIPPTGLIFATERNFQVNYSTTQKESVLKPGKYQFTGELVWKQQEKQKSLPFSFEVDIPLLADPPAETNTGREKVAQ